MTELTFYKSTVYKNTEDKILELRGKIKNLIDQKPAAKGDKAKLRSIRHQIASYTQEVENLKNVLTTLDQPILSAESAKSYIVEKLENYYDKTTDDFHAIMVKANDFMNLKSFEESVIEKKGRTSIADSLRYLYGNLIEVETTRKVILELNQRISRAISSRTENINEPDNLSLEELLDLIEEFLSDLRDDAIDSASSVNRSTSSLWNAIEELQMKTKVDLVRRSFSFPASALLHDFRRFLDKGLVYEDSDLPKYISEIQETWMKSPDDFLVVVDQVLESHKANVPWTIKNYLQNCIPD